MDVKTGRVVSLTKKSDSGIYYIGKKYDITYVGDNVEISVGMQGGAGYGTTTYTFVNEVLKKSYFVNASLGPSGNAVLTEYNKDASKKKVTYYNSAEKTVVATTDFTKTSDGKLGVKEFLEALTNSGIADMDGNANAISVQETALLQYLVGLNNNKALIKDIINGNFDNIDADTMEDLVELNDVLVSMKPQKPVITPGKRGSIEWIQNIMGLKIVIDDNSKEYYPDGRIMKFREGGMGFSFPTYNISYDDKEGTTKVFVSPDVEGNGIYKSYLYDADGKLINYAEYKRFKDLSGGDYYIDASKLNDAYESYEYDYSQQGFDNVPQFDKDGNRVPDSSGYRDSSQYDEYGNRIEKYQFDEYGNPV